MPKRIHGLFVGVDQYPEEIGALQFCSNDAAALRDFFAEHTASGNLKLLTPPDDEPGTSFKCHLLKELKDFSTCSFAEDDIFIFFFAGHGLNAGGQYYLVMDVPTDVVRDDLTTVKMCSLSLEELRKCVDQIEAHNQILIIDACRDDYGSRTLFNSGIDAAAEKAFSELKERKIRPASRFMRREIVSSCWHGQKSWEYKGGLHGWFTYHLLECLKFQTAPIDMGLLVSAVETRMKEMSHVLPEAAEQKPHLLLDGLPILLPLKAGTKLLPRLLIWCCLIDFARLLLETGPLSLLIASAGFLAAAMMSSSTSELALMACLSAFMVSMTLYGITVLTMVVVECLRIAGENWLKTAQGNVIRIAAWQNERLFFDGNSDLLMIVLGALDELATRIKSGKHPSRLLKSIERNRPYLQTGIAIGAVRAWAIGGLIWPVHGIQEKFLKSNSLGLTCFWMPLERESFRLLRALRGKRTTPEALAGRQTNARIKFYLPTTALGIDSVDAWTFLLGLVLLAILVPATWSAVTLIRRPAAPAVDGETRWWLRSKMANREQVNHLRLDFSHLEGDAREYFVVVEGQTRTPTRETNGDMLPTVAVRGRASLVTGNGPQHCGYAMVPIRAIGATVDPRLLMVSLQKQRSILGVTLPPQQIKLFGITKVNLYYDDEQP